ncbi:hypothetical protein MSAN_01980400 [Mycena sanguinolenta]|uniref:RlpA-like protein double-psi beta-barrel domain-containing protein n=1 Tax=Mycena sanguinolenta TaxID=230812 RepID=A0A8H7CMV3_9AGAR|nr:hypothetical protein MSAN_01980400 [Mycena sanguinolenta]
MFSKTFSALFLTALASAVSASPALQVSSSLRADRGIYSLLGHVASYYFPDGGIGACGNALQNGDFIVALGTDTWDGGAHCGQTVDVQYQGTSIQVTVQDLCEGCASRGANGLDLSQGAMAALDPNYVNDGIISVVWSFA